MKKVGNFLFGLALVIAGLAALFGVGVLLWQIAMGVWHWLTPFTWVKGAEIVGVLVVLVVSFAGYTIHQLSKSG